MSNSADPIAILGVSAPRRYFALAVQLALGVLLIGVALTLPEPAPMVQGVMIIIGALVLWRTRALFAATSLTIILDESGLMDSSGRQICALDNIASVDRGAFAFKPTNGFLVRLKEAEPKGWVPGLWWRFGRRVGVGGATSGKAARDMADVISLLLTEQGAELIASTRRD